MPCNTDYMEPNVRERQRRLAAQLLIYVYGRLGLTISTRIKIAADDIYGGPANDDFVTELCSILKIMSTAQIDEVVYDARDKTARQLADWWEEHQEEDRKREAIEVAADVKA